MRGSDEYASDTRLLNY